MNTNNQNKTDVNHETELQDAWADGYGEGFTDGYKRGYREKQKQTKRGIMDLVQACNMINEEAAHDWIAERNKELDSNGDEEEPSGSRSILENFYPY